MYATFAAAAFAQTTATATLCVAPNTQRLGATVGAQLAGLEHSAIVATA